MGISWGTRLPTAVAAASILCVTLAACESGSPAAPDALNSAETDTMVAAPAQLSSGGRITPQAADTIQINGGTIIVASRQPGTVELRGSRGFRFEGVMHSLGVDPNRVCQTDSPCLPGQSVSFNGTWAGLDLPGTARMQGQTFLDVGGLNSDTGLRVDVAGSFVAPPQSATATVVVPATISGVFISPEGLFELEGDGRATLTLEWVEASGVPPTWVLRQIRFDFGGGGNT